MYNYIDLITCFLNIGCYIMSDPLVYSFCATLYVWLIELEWLI